MKFTSNKMNGSRMNEMLNDFSMLCFDEELIDWKKVFQHYVSKHDVHKLEYFIGM